jgi:cephalosporin hydroxylase
MNTLDVIKEFNVLFYNLAPLTWDSITWMGRKIWKNPYDLWVMQEIIYEIQPDFIIETGTYQGGSALYFAHLLDILDHGKIITIDINPNNWEDHPRITYIQGNSVNDLVFESVISVMKSINISLNSNLVILDSDHSKEHVLKELQLYSKFIRKGSYIIVEDTNIGAPLEAVKEFLNTSEGKNFIIDRSKERLLCTFNPMGYLKKIR